MESKKNRDWSTIEPIETIITDDNNPVQFEVTDSFLGSTDYMIRDPRDIVMVNDIYYV